MLVGGVNGTISAQESSTNQYAQLPLEVTDAVSRPLWLVFRGGAVHEGKRIFLRIKTSRKVYFSDVGDEIEGYILADYREKLKTADPGGRRDESEVTLTNGTNSITLGMGDSYYEYKATVFDPDKNKEFGVTYSVKRRAYRDMEEANRHKDANILTETGTQFGFRGKEYRVMAIDIVAKRVLVTELLSGNKYWIEKAQRSPRSDVPKASPQE